MPLVPELLMEVAMAIAVGGLIGMEREHTEEEKYAGVRTLSLLAGAGPGVVALSTRAETPVFVSIYLALAAVLALAIAAVRYDIEGEDLGFTTSTAVFVVAVLAAMIGYDLYSEATALAILVTLLLAQKKTLHSYIDRLKKEEISRALQLGALSFILLPILPSTPGPLGIVPRQVLLLAIFVLSIQFLAYISLRQLETAGIYLTGVLGGAASSFATTGVMARMAGDRQQLFNPISSATNLAAVSMIARNVAIATLVLLPATQSFSPLFPMYAATAGMAAPLMLAAYLLKHESESVDLEIESPFSLKTGAKFALIFVAVSAVSTLGEQSAGTLGIYATAFTGGLVSSTAVATSAATSFGSGSITGTVAAGMIMLSIAGSILSKIALVELVNQELRENISLPMIISIASGLAVFLAL